MTRAALLVALGSTACLIAEPTRDVFTTDDAFNARFAPTDPASVRLVAGREDERGYVILGIVEGGATEGFAPVSRDAYEGELRKAAASLGADTVLDVKVVPFAFRLRGLAARRRAR